MAQNKAKLDDEKCTATNMIMIWEEDELRKKLKNMSRKRFVEKKFDLATKLFNE